MSVSVTVTVIDYFENPTNNHILLVKKESWKQSGKFMKIAISFI